MEMRLCLKRVFSPAQSDCASPNDEKLVDAIPQLPCSEKQQDFPALSRFPKLSLHLLLPQSEQRVLAVLAVKHDTLPDFPPSCKKEPRSASARNGHGGCQGVAFTISCLSPLTEQRVQSSARGPQFQYRLLSA
eukprot:2486869-Rhodomonas_salina.3